MSIILYSARSPLTADHQPIYLPLPGGHVDTIYIRVVRVAVPPLEALDLVDPMDGETFLNSIPEAM
jgi:hypothetical protein